MYEPLCPINHCNQIKHKLAKCHQNVNRNTSFVKQTNKRIIPLILDQIYIIGLSPGLILKYLLNNS